MPSPFGLFGRSDADGSPTIEFLPPDDRAFGPASGAGGAADAGGVTFVGFDRDGFEGSDGNDGFDGGGDWGGLDDDEGSAPAPRSRWAPLLAGLAVAGLLIGGVVAAAPWSGDDASTSPTTTSPSGRTERPATDPATPVAPLSTAVSTPVPGVEGWVLDPPVAGLTPWLMLDDAASADGVRRDEVGSGGWGEVWATDDATRTSGRWFSLTLLPFRELEEVEPGWIAVELDGRRVRASTAPDGVVRVRFAQGQIDDPRLVTIDAFGFSLPQLFELAASVAIVDDRPQLADDRPGFTRPELIDGLQQVAARSTDRDLIDAALLGGPLIGGMYYRGPATDDVTLVQTRPAAEVDPVLTRLTFAPLAGSIDPATAFAGFVPTDVVVGTRTFEGIELSVVRWVVDDDDVWLITTLSSGVLVAMLDDARRLSAPEWAERRDSLERTPLPDSVLPPDGGSGVVFGEGTTPGGDDWSLSVRPLTGAISFESSTWGEIGTSFGAVMSTGSSGPNGSFGTIAFGDTTIVIGVSTVEATSLRVRLPDGAERTNELVALPIVDDPPTEPGRLDPSFWTSWSGSHMGVVALDPGEVSAGGFVAEIVAADGTVVATFDAWGSPDGG